MLPEEWCGRYCVTPGSWQTVQSKRSSDRDSSLQFRIIRVPSSRGLGHHPLKVETRVRTPLGLPEKSSSEGISGNRISHRRTILLLTLLLRSSTWRYAFPWKKDLSQGAGMRGHIRERGKGTWELRVFLGRTRHSPGPLQDPHLQRWKEGSGKRVAHPPIDCPGWCCQRGNVRGAFGAVVSGGLDFEGLVTEDGGRAPADHRQAARASQAAWR